MASEYYELPEMVLNGSNCRYALGDDGTLLNYAAENKALQQAGETFSVLDLSMLLPKGSENTHALSRETLRLTENGTIPSMSEYIERIHGKQHIQFCVELSNVEVLFIICLTFCIVMFFATVLWPNRSSLNASEQEGAPTKFTS